MSLMKKKKKKKLDRINIIPILDAVFIFIFFLLMSAQFLEIYEIDSDAPAIAMLSEQDEKKKEPLNLVLEIKKNKLLVKVGMDERVLKKLSNKNMMYDFKGLNRILISIKKKNINETSVIFRPNQNISYEHIVKLMDTVRTVKGEQGPISASNKSGDVITTRTLFNKIIFETNSG